VAVWFFASLDSEETGKKTRRKMGTWVGPIRGTWREYEMEEGNDVILQVSASVFLFFNGDGCNAHDKYFIH
jgi:hypothetical protein